MNDEQRGELVATTTLRFTLEAVELFQRVQEAIANNQAMLLGPDKLRLLLGEPVVEGER